MDTSDRALAVRAQLEQLKTVEPGPPCTRCIYGPINDTGVGKCDHIVHWQIQHDPLSGKRRGRLAVTTEEARSADGLCGPEGLLFEPYPPFRRVARWLASLQDMAIFVAFWAILGLFMLVVWAIITIRGAW